MSKNTCKFSIFAFILTMILFVVFVFSTTAVFAAEGDAAETTSETANSFYNYLKTIDMDQIKVWLAVLVAYMTGNSGLFLALLIAYIRNKSKALKQSEFYENLIAKMSAENQAKTNEVLDKINAKLDDSARATQNYIKKQNSEKREIAKSNVEQMQKALSEVTVTLDSE